MSIIECNLIFILMINIDILSLIIFLSSKLIIIIYLEYKMKFINEHNRM